MSRARERQFTDDKVLSEFSGGEADEVVAPYISRAGNSRFDAAGARDGPNATAYLFIYRPRVCCLSRRVLVRADALIAGMEDRAGFVGGGRDLKVNQCLVDRLGFRGRERVSNSSLYKFAD